MTMQPKTKHSSSIKVGDENSTRTKSDWYIAGTRWEHGRDELWNFWDEPFNISPHYIQGDKPFIREMEDLFGNDYGKKLAQDIICALDNTYEKEIVGQDKIDLLTGIDMYYKDYLGEDFFENCFVRYSTNQNIVVYSLLLKGGS